MKKVGIPHSLFYYYHYPLWKTFFADLGAKVVTSPATNRLIIDQGINLAVDELCFPIKSYYGHVMELSYQPLDYIFIPRLVSIEHKGYICPKFMGLPDMIKASIPNLPEVIDITIDLSKSDKTLNKDIIKLGQLFTHNKRLIKDALEHATNEFYLCRSLTKQGYTMAEAIKIWEGEEITYSQESEITIGVLGHGYSLYDEMLSMDIVNKLRNLKCRVVLPEYLEREKVENAAATIPKRVFWTLGRKMVGSALHMEEIQEVDGIIYLACFGCGPDSLIGEIIERKIIDKPFMLLTIDEHTGEGGIMTRLEAFCDMLHRRRYKVDENNLSAHG
ncbi:MAG TPA: acyl-CoA dehydratase activase-related protein [Syntrophomonadaceae bacterium]|nr:acyl-CoA dehydratase activase-related protein [Syntrophomonadaceae bacterium]